ENTTMSQKWANNGAGPIQCKQFNDVWGKLNWENKTFVELTGVIGVSEHSTTMTNLFGTNMRADVEAVKENIGAQFNWTVTAENAAQIVKAIEAELPELAKTRPVKDLRRTPEQEIERNAEVAQIHAEQTEKERKQHETFVNVYGSGQTVTVRPGHMA